MKKLTKSLLATGALLAATSAAAFVDTMCPVVGVDYQHVWMKEKNGEANPVNNSGFLPKSYPGASVYVGTRFYEYLGAELGYDWAAKKTKNVSFGNVAGVGNNISTNTSVKRQGGHFDLLTYVPVADCFELMFGAGIGYITAKTQITVTSSTAGAGSSQNVKPKGAVGRIRLGGNYMFNECMGLRALLGWEGTSSLKTTVSGITHKSYPFQDSVTAAVGLFYKF